jgi:HD-GYP domain-containing protein (c-di-GMP phosphodiesterase class II)
MRADLSRMKLTGADPIVYHAPSRPELIGGADASRVRLSEVVSALSVALDITEGQPAGHAMRNCWIGMGIASAIGLGAAERSALFYALLLKDLGCSNNASKMCYLFGGDDIAAKHDFKTADTTRLGERVRYIARNVAPDGTLLQKSKSLAHLVRKGPSEAAALITLRCERGANIARVFGLSEDTARAIHALDEHWDGRGHPTGTKGDDIPLLGRILCLAQTVEVFHARDGVDGALAMAQRRSGRWFDPQLVRALVGLRGDAAFWGALSEPSLGDRLAAIEPDDYVMHADESMLDRISWGFAQVVDAKSPWTYRHSEGVAQIAVGIGQAQGLTINELRDLRRAGLLHDIGKLGVSNTILDKPGRLTDDERAAVQRHPEFSERILRGVPCLRHLAELAATHHERMDGHGYYRGIGEAGLSRAARALVVADIFEALSAERPYRETMSRERVLSILGEMSGDGVCPESLAALRTHLDEYDYVPHRMDTGDACAGGSCNQTPA